MFFYLISLISFMNSIMFLLMNHPLAMGLMLLFQTTIISLMSSFCAQTYWFSYVLFLIFLGGMLVLFIYVTSLASNEMFNFSIKILMFFFSFFLFFMIIMMFIDKLIITNYFKNLECLNMNFMKFFINENNLILNKLYSFPINTITMMLMIYLFLTLIAVVKITNIFEGPLRPCMNN